MKDVLNSSFSKTITEDTRLTLWKTSQFFLGQGHVTVCKPAISIIYIVAHTWPLFSAQILVDGVNPQET